MTPTCELVDRQATPALVLRTRAPLERLPQVLGPAWGAVMTCAGKAGAEPSSPPFAAFHNMDMSDFDLEIGFTFERPLVGEGDVLASEVPVGKAVEAVHVGPFDQLRATYQVMQTWMAERGLGQAGPSYEFYLDDPQDTPPAELRTRIVIPVR